MPLPDRVETEFVSLLADIYSRIRWDKLSTSKNAWDVFNHRVRAAACRGTLGEFVSRLCNAFGLQSLPPESLERVAQLREHEKDLLDWTFREHIVVAMRAVLMAKSRRDEATTTTRSRDAQAKHSR